MISPNLGLLFDAIIALGIFVAIELVNDTVSFFKRRRAGKTQPSDSVMAAEINNILKHLDTEVPRLHQRLAKIQDSLRRSPPPPTDPEPYRNTVLGGCSPQHDGLTVTDVMVDAAYSSLHEGSVPVVRTFLPRYRIRRALEAALAAHNIPPRSFPPGWTQPN